MHGYFGVSLPISACLHFSREEDIHSAEEEVSSALDIGMDVAYFNAQNKFMNSLGFQLNLENAPYQEGNWVRFLDDIITKAYRSNGVLIIIDQAGGAISGLDREIFDFIESMMIQFHHWPEVQKPFHVCFQIEECVGSILSSALGRRCEF